MHRVSRTAAGIVITNAALVRSECPITARLLSSLCGPHYFCLRGFETWTALNKLIKDLFTDCPKNLIMLWNLR